MTRLWWLAAAGAIAATLFLARRPAPRVETVDEPVAEPTLPTAVSPPLETPAPLIPLVTSADPAPPALADLESPSSALPDADTHLLVVLGGRLQARSHISANDLESGEALLRRHPDAPAARVLLEALLYAVASQERTARQPEKAALRFRRAVELRPEEVRPRAGLVSALLEASDWAGAEAAARDLLAREPRHPEALRALGFALMRQDRSREAQEALRASMEARDDAATRALLDRVQKAESDERGMTEQRLAHFNVRYDGEAHDGVGREILRALERHYASLARRFDHRPAATIPVVLFSEQSYFDATGAPFWSGGQYSHFDGRVSIPIGGLTSALTPTLDDVLIHEVAHAFVHDLSRGVAPRDIHEGLAQYVEGKRVEAVLGATGLIALSEGRVSGVSAFYLSALGLVEQLAAERGQGGLNEMLRLMGETGSVDEAFRRVYGRDHAQAAEVWAARLRQRHSR
jgi:tetratricopeptide (TPR) repeat protein